MRSNFQRGNALPKHCSTVFLLNSNFMCQFGYSTLKRFLLWNMELCKSMRTVCGLPSPNNFWNIPWLLYLYYQKVNDHKQLFRCWYQNTSCSFTYLHTLHDQCYSSIHILDFLLVNSRVGSKCLTLYRHDLWCLLHTFTNLSCCYSLDS